MSSAKTIRNAMYSVGIYLQCIHTMNITLLGLIPPKTRLFLVNCQIHFAEPSQLKMPANAECWMLYVKHIWQIWCKTTELGLRTHDSGMLKTPIYGWEVRSVCVKCHPPIIWLVLYFLLYFIQIKPIAGYPQYLPRILILTAHVR